MKEYFELAADNGNLNAILKMIHHYGNEDPRHTEKMLKYCAFVEKFFPDIKTFTMERHSFTKHLDVWAVSWYPVFLGTPRICLDF